MIIIIMKEHLILDAYKQSASAEVKYNFAQYNH